MSCQDKVAQQWKLDWSHLFGAGRNDGGIMFAEAPLSMHILSYKGKEGGLVCFFSPLELPSPSLNCTCRHYCLCDYRSSAASLPASSCSNHRLACSSSFLTRESLQNLLLFFRFHCSFGLSCCNEITSHPFPAQYLGASLRIPLS